MSTKIKNGDLFENFGWKRFWKQFFIYISYFNFHRRCRVTLRHGDLMKTSNTSPRVLLMILETQRLDIQIWIGKSIIITVILRRFELAVQFALSQFCHCSAVWSGTPYIYRRKKIFYKLHRKSFSNPKSDCSQQTKWFIKWYIDKLHWLLCCFQKSQNNSYSASILGKYHNACKRISAEPS